MAPSIQCWLHKQEAWLWIPSTHANNLGWQYVSAVPETWRQRPEHPWDHSHTSAYKLQVQRDNLSQRLTWNNWRRFLESSSQVYTHTHTQHLHTQNTHTQFMYMRTMTNFTALISAFIVQSSPWADRYFQCRNYKMELVLSQLQKPKGRGRCYPCTWHPHTLLAKLSRHLWSDSLNRKAIRTGKGVLTRVFPILWEPVQGKEIPPYRAFRGLHQRCVYTDRHTEQNLHTISEEATASKRSLFQSPVALDKRHFKWFSLSSLTGPSQSLGASLLASGWRGSVGCFRCLSPDKKDGSSFIPYPQLSSKCKSC